jgi:hypothetical protein
VATQERQDIEALVFRRGFEPRVLSCCLPYVGQGGKSVPRTAIHERPSVNIERAAQAQQPMVPARRAHSFGPTHAHEPITLDAKLRQPGPDQALASQCLNGIAP